MNKKDKKKEKEKFIFDKFKELYTEFPPGTYNHIDSPDFILTTSPEQTIGIEITEAFYDQSQMQKSEYQIRFNQDVLEKLGQLLPYRFYFSIHLDQKPQINQSNYKQVIDETVEICFNEFFDLENLQKGTINDFGHDITTYPLETQSIIIAKGYRNLPKGVRRIRITRYDVLNKSSHGHIKGGAVPNFEQEHLDRILKDKNKSITKYKKCDSQWLLIAEGGDFYSHFDNINIEEIPNTEFDKVFMIRTFPPMVIVLKS
ncbi:MAG TPA: hypothetical protein VIU35_05970 [Chitinophagaceae bacterium]